MDHAAESPRIRNPYDNLRTTEQLLRANVQVAQLILAELVQIRKLLTEELERPGRIEGDGE